MNDGMPYWEGWFGAAKVEATPERIAEAQRLFSTGWHTAKSAVYAALAFDPNITDAELKRLEKLKRPLGRPKPD